MHIAWLRPTSVDGASPLDDTAALIDALRDRHTIDVFDERRAHDLVWLHARTPFHMCVYELDDTSAHQYVWPYLLRYSGIVLLRNVSMYRSRSRALERQQRRDDLARELEFSRRPMLRAPLVASRAVGVAHRSIADALRIDYPEANIRHLPIGIRPITSSSPPARAETTFGFLDTGDRRQVDVLRRAAQRARDAGAHVELLIDRDLHALHAADVVMALHWPTNGNPLADAIAVMASRRASVVFDTLETADWPSLDPQTWQPRAGGSDRPICVSIDLRDEEHSLMLTMRRLAADGELRRALGEAAHAWWRREATVERASAAFESLLEEAVSLPPPPRPVDWPAHLTADGTERAREMLAELGVSVDFL
jgi:hypothetical protein